MKLGEYVGPDLSDWARVDAMTEEDIQRGIASDPDNPEMTDEDFAEAVIVIPAKVSTHVRIDRDVFEWFRSQGPGHLTRMNAVLRRYYIHSKGKEARAKTLKHEGR